MSYPNLVQWINPSDYFSDLVVEGVDPNQTDFEWGQNLFIASNVRNLGFEPAASTTIRFYLSTNSVISTFDTQLGTEIVPPLAWQGSSAEFGGPFPMTLSGKFWIGACVDAVGSEGPSGNNCSPGVPIQIEQRPPQIFDDRFEQN